MTARFRTVCSVAAIGFGLLVATGCQSGHTASLDELGGGFAGGNGVFGEDTTHPGAHNSIHIVHATEAPCGCTMPGATTKPSSEHARR